MTDSIDFLSIELLSAENDVETVGSTLRSLETTLLSPQPPPALVDKVWEIIYDVLVIATSPLHAGVSDLSLRVLELLCNTSSPPEVVLMLTGLVLQQCHSKDQVIITFTLLAKAILRIENVKRRRYCVYDVCKSVDRHIQSYKNIRKAEDDEDNMEAEHFEAQDVDTHTVVEIMHSFVNPLILSHTNETMSIGDRAPIVTLLCRGLEYIATVHHDDDDISPFYASANTIMVAISNLGASLDTIILLIESEDDQSKADVNRSCRGLGIACYLALIREDRQSFKWIPSIYSQSRFLGLLVPFIHQLLAANDRSLLKNQGLLLLHWATTNMELNSWRPRDAIGNSKEVVASHVLQALFMLSLTAPSQDDRGKVVKCITNFLAVQDNDWRLETIIMTIRECPFPNVISWLVDTVRRYVASMWPTNLSLIPKAGKLNGFISVKVITVILSVLDLNLDIESGADAITSAVNLLYLLLKKENSVLDSEGHTHQVGAWESLVELKHKYLNNIVDTVSKAMRSDRIDILSFNLTSVLDYAAAHHAEMSSKT